MIDPQPHVVAITGLAIVTALICHFARNRLRVAGLVLAGSFGVIITGQLVFGMKAPALTILAALCDMITLGVIGWVMVDAKHRLGLHLAGVSMCVSLMAHVAYHFVGIGEGATLTYFVVTNTCMALSCLGLIWSSLETLVARNGMVGSYDHSYAGCHSWNYRMAQRRKAKSL